MCARERTCLRRSRVLDEIIKGRFLYKMQKRATLNPLHASYVADESGKNADVLVGTNTAAMEVESGTTEVPEALKNEEKEEADMDLEATVDVVLVESDSGRKYEQRTSNVSILNIPKRFSSRASMHTHEIFEGAKNNMTKSLEKNLRLFKENCNYTPSPPFDWDHWAGIIGLFLGGGLGILPTVKGDGNI